MDFSKFLHVFVKNVWISKLLHGFVKIEISYFFAILQGNVLFSGKIYLAGEKNLHDRRS